MLVQNKMYLKTLSISIVCILSFVARLNIEKVVLIIILFYGG